MRRTKPVTVTLGEMQERVEARVHSGDYASVSEVLRAGLRALDREEAALDALIREKVREALDEGGPCIPADEVFAELRAHHQARVDAERGA